MNGNYFVRDLRVNEFEDAERLAAMFSTFDSVWPGGFMNGVVPTPEHMFEGMRKMRRLAICVVQHDNEFVGFCDMDAQAGETDLAYIPLLGAGPGHHGKGVGKSLLLEMIRRATAFGFREVSLNTWGGNLKAVPLYKKTGFNWMPETNVYMRNFIPGILNSTAGTKFFKNRDWYALMERSLEVSPDDNLWNGIRVYPYRFREGDDYLKVVVEDASGGITAIETPEYSLECVAAASKRGVAAGDTIRVTWRIRSNSGRKVEILLLAEPQDGLEISVCERIQLEGSTEFTRDLRVSPDAAPRKRGERQRCLKSTLLIDGTPFVLESGVKVVRPIEIEIPDEGLIAGRDEKVTIRLQSNLDRAISGTISLDSHADIVGSGATHPFSLESGGATQWVTKLKGKRPGTATTTLRWQADALHGTRPLPLRIVGGTSTVASIDAAYDAVAVEETVGFKLVHQLCGGNVTIENRSSGRTLGLSMGSLGPPFTSFRRRQLICSARMEQTEDRQLLVVSVEQPEYPGIVLERRIVPIAGDLLRIDYRIVNTGANTTDPGFSMRIAVHLNEYEQLVYPGENGIVREPPMDWDNFPAGAHDALATPEGLTESWICAEYPGAACGLFWEGKARFETDWSKSMTFALGEVDGFSSVSAPTLYAYVGAGSWENLRGWWKRLILPSGSEVHDETEAPPTLRVLNIETQTTPLLLTTDDIEVQLLARNARRRAISGTVSLTGTQVSLDPAVLELKNLDRDSGGKQFTVHADFDSAYRTGSIDATLNTIAWNQIFRLPVVRLAASGHAAVTINTDADGVYSVSNGVLTFRVAPAFLGSVISLQSDGIEHLFSAWPQSRPFVWSNPWFGGIHPCLGWMGDDEITREAFEGASVAVVGSSGLVWSGVRVHCRCKDRKRTWLTIETDYLTHSGSSLMAVVTRFTNGSGAAQKLAGGTGVWPTMNGDRSTTVSYWSHKGEIRHRRRGSGSFENYVGNWGAVENASIDRRLQTVVSGKDSRIMMMDFAEDGSFLQSWLETSMKPGETREQITWVVVNPAVDAFVGFAELAALKSLP